MRIIILLLLTLFLVRPVLSQQPTKAEMDAQMKQASREAKQQIADLKKQIAEAKANGEDAKSIQEMEKQLVTVEKMLAAVEQIGTFNESKPKTVVERKTVLPKYKSPTIAISLSPPIVVPTKDKAKDTMFWFVGRKKDDSTLITPTATVVRYSRSRNLIIVQPDTNRDTTMYMMLAKGIALTEKIKNDFVIKIDGIKNSFFMYPQIQMAFDEFNMQRDRYYELAKNNIPCTPIDNLYSQQDYDDMQRQLEALRDQLNQKMESLPEITEEQVRLSLPPERPVNLCWCDETERQKFETEVSSWNHDFYKDEHDLKIFIANMTAEIESCRQRGFTRPIRDWNATIFKAQRLVINRQRTKLELLTDVYEEEKNIRREEGLALAAINFKNSLDMLQQIFPDDKAIKAQGDFRFNRVKDIVKSDKYFDDFIEQKKSEKNYMVVFDYGLYASHEMSKSNLTQQYGNTAGLASNWIDRLAGFNRFTLKITLEFQLELRSDQGAEMIASGTLESDEMIVRLGQLGCKWQLYLMDANYEGLNTNENEFYINFLVTGGSKDYIHDKFPPFPYTGPQEMKMVFPSIRMSFCDANPDSLMVSLLRYTDADLKRYAHTNVARSYTVDLLAYVEKMFVGIKQTQENQTELADIVTKMVGVATTSQPSSSTGNATLDKLMMNYLMNLQWHDRQAEVAHATHTGQTIILFDAVNKGPVLINNTPHSTIDQNDKDRKIGVVLTKSEITISVEHKPL